MVGCPHGDGGHGLRPAARPAHQGGRYGRAGVEGAAHAVGTDESATAPHGGPTAHGEKAEPDRHPAAPPSPAATGEVKSYDTDGGRAVFDLGRDSASLVSATPGAGWSMQVWKTESWIRVEFSSGADRVSVFCTWHDGPPRVEIGTY
ncbi:putative Penicillin-binding protein activator LpoA [Streptomyces afghaniensis 772]|uniref:Putative Penicillin-binding protein activator LpoA n=1 Tax=Streptomyces afghaniensis 772 TaxID=1283301 RepID=S4MEJ5_9ACTN|nr:putative Penicillin-binding protein activator LpoA [Streptomyces afghaniensis 772]